MKPSNLETLTRRLEELGYGWDIGYAGRLREARVWNWPYCIGRYRPTRQEPLDMMLTRAIVDAGIENEVEGDVP